MKTSGNVGFLVVCRVLYKGRLRGRFGGGLQAVCHHFSVFRPVSHVWGLVIVRADSSVCIWSGDRTESGVAEEGN